MESYIVAFAASIVFAGLILTDKVMSSSTYTRPTQALAVSTVLNFAWSWSVYLFWDYKQPSAESAWMGILAGAVMVIYTGVYFVLIFSPHGEATEVSAWDSSSPVALLLMSAVLPLTEAISRLQVLGLVMVPIGLFLLIVWGDNLTTLPWKIRGLMALLPLAGGLHIWCANHAEALAMEQFAAEGITDTRVAFASISPFYWIGSLVGVIPLLVATERRGFAIQWPVIRGHWRRILLVEFLAMAGFSAQLYGFTDSHPAVINTLVSMFPIWIFLGGIALRRLAGFSPEAFPVVKHPIKKALVVCFLIMAVVLTVH